MIKGRSLFTTEKFLKQYKLVGNVKQELFKNKELINIPNRMANEPLKKVVVVKGNKYIFKFFQLSEI